ncbi:hypothetical protein niasHT_019425 [Heterodera trifolii]|uniref:Uncharacterized protein n=1 Tax=Heterodera trifolii TaxID=157864 RepID=A0ABD2KW26_9BILA
MSDIYGFINNISDRISRRVRRKRPTESGVSGVGGAPPETRKDDKAKGGGSSKKCACIILCSILTLIVLVIGGLVLAAALAPETFKDVPLLKLIAREKKDGGVGEKENITD